MCFSIRCYMIAARCNHVYRSCIFRPIGFLENMSLSVFKSNHLRSRKIQFLRTLIILIWETCSVWKTLPFSKCFKPSPPMPAFKAASNWAFSSSLAFCKFSWACPGMVDKVRFLNLLQLLSPGAPRMKKGQIRRSWSWSTPNSTSIFFCPLDGKTLWDTVGKKTWNTGHGNPHPSLPFKVSKWPFRPWRIWGSQENPTVTWYLAIGQKTMVP